MDLVGCVLGETSRRGHQRVGGGDLKLDTSCWISQVNEAHTLHHINILQTFQKDRYRDISAYRSSKGCLAAWGCATSRSKTVRPHLLYCKAGGREIQTSKTTKHLRLDSLQSQFAQLDGSIFSCLKLDDMIRSTTCRVGFPKQVQQPVRILKCAYIENCTIPSTKT